MSIDVNRERAIDLAVSQIEKQFGKGAIMKLGEEALAQDVACLPTGSLGLDIALGIGGIPRGRVVEIYGPESSGKTTLALQLIAEGQKRGGICAFIDAEHALDMGYARKLGVKTEDLLISQPDHGEQALEIADTLVRSGALDVLVIDSVAALVPRAEIEGDMGDPQMGLQARLMSQALRKLIDIASEQGIVEKTGAWYAFGGDRIGQGRENARDFLREHPEVAAQIEARVREKFGLRSGAAEGGNGASAEGVRAAEAARRGRGGKE